mgnify:CR=1 FL=1
MTDLETMMAMLKNSQIFFELTEFPGSRETELLIEEGYIGFFSSLTFCNVSGRLRSIEAGER